MGGESESPAFLSLQRTDVLCSASYSVFKSAVPQSAVFFIVFFK